MMSIISDSHKLVEGLKKKDFSKKQAEGIKEAFDQIDISHLATKKDLGLLRQEIKTDMANLKSEIKTEIFKMMLAQAALIVALIKLL